MHCLISSNEQQSPLPLSILVIEGNSGIFASSSICSIEYWEKCLIILFAYFGLSYNEVKLLKPLGEWSTKVWILSAISSIAKTSESSVWVFWIRVLKFSLLSRELIAFCFFSIWSLRLWYTLSEDHFCWDFNCSISGVWFSFLSWYA